MSFSSVIINDNFLSWNTVQGSAQCPFFLSCRWCKQEQNNAFSHGSPPPSSVAQVQQSQAPACLLVGAFRMDCTHAPKAGKFLWSSVAPWWGAMSAPPHVARRATSPPQSRALTNEPMTPYPVPSCHLLSLSLGPALYSEAISQWFWPLGGC